jgi:hypothetical protein
MRGVSNSSSRFWYVLAWIEDATVTHTAAEHTTPRTVHFFRGDQLNGCRVSSGVMVTVNASSGGGGSSRSMSAAVDACASNTFSSDMRGDSPIIRSGR